MAKVEEIEPSVTIVIGRTRIGKTVQNVREIDVYTSNHNGKKPRKALIFDINNEKEYRKYQTLNPTPENIQKFIHQPTIEARRIACVNQDGSGMTPKEKMKLLKLVIQNFRDGMFCLDDIDKVAMFSRDQDFIGILMGMAHVGLDPMITKQSIGMVSQYEFRNLTYIRLHKTVDSIRNPTVRKRAVNYELIRIAELIINEQVDVVKNIRYFLYIDMRNLWLIGCSRAAFNRALQKFIYEEGSLLRDEIREMQREKLITEKEKHTIATADIAEKRLMEKYQHFIPEHIKA